LKSHWLQITSGRGPEECAFVVGRLADVLRAEMDKAGISYRELEVVQASHSDASLSVLFSLQGEGVTAFVDSWKGTIQWIVQSPYRPHHKRKNWFVGVNSLVEPDPFEWSVSDFSIESMRTTGPGGQHVNKTESAIRVTHLPTGLTVVAREERSQHQNKKLALARMIGLLQVRRAGVEAESKSDKWSHHNNLIRGNPIHVFRGVNFELVRT